MLRKTFEACIEQGYNRIPLVREVLADLDTPLSTYLKLADGPYSYLFESVQGGEKWGRYSIIGLPAQETIHIHNHNIEIHVGDTPIESFETDDPLAWIEAKQNAYNIPELDELPRFTGGLVGYFGYETIGYIEPKLSQQNKIDLLDTPDILLMVSDEVVVFDNLAGKLFLIVHVDANLVAYDAGQDRLEALYQQLRKPLAYPTDKHADSTLTSEADFVSSFPEDSYKDAVSTARDYIKSGDVMQVVLSQRLSVPFKHEPLDLYRTLRSLNPSPYMYFLQLDNFCAYPMER